jgi:hypothetical protein
MNRTSNKLLLVVLVLVICVVGFGFYRGWFALSSSNVDKGSNKVNVNLTMDGNKMQEDAATVQSKTAELTGGAKNEANEPGEPASRSK